MSDQELLDESEAGGGEEKKKSGVGRLGKLLPTLFKIVGFGLGAVILIVTVSVITYNLLSRGGKQQTNIPVTESYLGKKPQYQMFSLLGPLTVQTMDSTYMVRVDMVFAYDENDNTAGAEFSSRLAEIRDSLRQYFRNKTAEQLRPENEEQLKREIQQRINTQILDKARIRKVLFNAFDIMETG
jgi:flagellar FliL protein